MRFLTTLIIFNLLTVQVLLLRGQNLVPDPSFELLKPEYQNQDTVWIPQQDMPFCKPERFLQHWVNPTKGTPDYRNVIFIDNYHIPTGTAPGPQVPRTGQAHLGLATYGSIAYPNGREYLSTMLTSPLVPGQWYKAGFYVSYPEINRLASNNLGMLFSTVLFHRNDFMVHEATPQMESDVLVTDKENWVKLESVFKADSAYTYLTLGCFRNDAATQSYVVNPEQFYWDSGYYWFDDIFVTPITASIEGDSIICKGSKATLTVTGDMQWAWANSASPNDIIGTDSILTVYPNQTTTYICYGLIDTLAHTVFVHSPPDPISISDSILCEGESLEIIPNVNSAASYIWSNGQSGGNLLINQAGTYALTVTDYPCVLHEEITVNYTSAPPYTALPDTAFCPGAPIEIGIHIPFTNYQWNTGQTSSHINIDQGGNYTLLVDNACGQYQLDVYVEQKDCPCQFFIPNSFTPDGDGLNDSFRPITNCRLIEYAWQVYDRWGNLLYSTQNPDEVWKAEGHPNGIYVIKLHYKGKDNAQLKIETITSKLILIK